VLSVDRTVAMDARRAFATTPTSGPDTNMYTFDELDSTQFGAADSVSPAFDYNDFINTDYTSSPMSQPGQLNFGSPGAFAVHKIEQHSPLPHIQPRSAVSSTSPESSAQDSSSDSSGRRKRKSPSSASPAAMFGSYASQEPPVWTDSMDIDRKRRPKHDSPVLRTDDTNLGITSMTESFNINSAGNSPPGLVNTPPATQWSNTPRSIAEHDLVPVILPNTI
jgi:hypothetical protein